MAPHCQETVLIRHAAEAHHISPQLHGLGGILEALWRVSKGVGRRLVVLAPWLPILAGLSSSSRGSICAGALGSSANILGED